MRQWIGTTFLTAFCGDALLSMASVLRPALEQWSDWFSMGVLAFSALVFVLALLGKLRPRLLFLAPTLCYFAIVAFALVIGVLLVVASGPRGLPKEVDLQFIFTVLPWFRPVLWVLLAMQLLVGLLCLAGYVRFIDREPTG